MPVLQALILVLVGANFYTFGLLYIAAQIMAVTGTYLWHMPLAYVLTSLVLVFYYLFLAQETMPDYFEE